MVEGWPNKMCSVLLPDKASQTAQCFLYDLELFNELKGFDLVKYRAEREKVLRESHIKAIAFNEVLERYSSEAVLAVTAALKDCPGMLDRLRENCPLMRPTDRSSPSSPEHPDPRRP